MREPSEQVFGVGPPRRGGFSSSGCGASVGVLAPNVEYTKEDQQALESRHLDPTVLNWYRVPPLSDGYE